MLDLTGRVIVITGASSGIGEAVALACGAQGMHVVLAARRAERLERIAEQVETVGGTALVCPTDIRSIEQIERLVSTTRERFGRIDVLLANAGMGYHSPVSDASHQEMEELVATNLLGVMHSARAVLPTMRAQKSGHIITVSSVVIGLMWPNDALYACTKAGVHRFSKGLRNEVREDGIQVTDLIPGVIDTPLTAGMQGIARGEVNAVAQAVVHLIRYPKPVLVIPAWYRLAMLANALFPGLIDRILARIP